MRNVLPTGVREPLACDVAFATTGDVSSNHINIDHCKWEGLSRTQGVGIARLVWKIGPDMDVVDRFTVHRTANWGWELRVSTTSFEPCTIMPIICGMKMILAMKTNCSSGRLSTRNMINQEEMWGDLTRNIIMQEKPQLVQATRFHKYH